VAPKINAGEKKQMEARMRFLRALPFVALSAIVALPQAENHPGNLDNEAVAAAKITVFNNDSGDVTGTMWDKVLERRRGFVRWHSGIIEVFDGAANGDETTGHAINSSGQIAGVYRDTIALQVRAFLRARNGKITVINVPTAKGGAFANDINP
jgi:hypothetical protein